LRVSELPRDLQKNLVAFDPDEASAERLCGDTSCSRSGKRIEHHIGRRGRMRDQSSDQSLRLFMRMLFGADAAHPDEMVAAFPDQSFSARNPFALRVKLSHQGAMHEFGLVPDLVFGLKFPDGSRRCFMVEIDRGTMPIVRANPSQTSFERKMRVYLAAHAAKQHERHFGWKTFRVLTISTDHTACDR
jgi:hypothetical protein